MTPISRESPPALPDPQVQTDLIRTALESAITALRQSATPHAALISAELESMRDALAPPSESYPGLAELDKALAEALTHLEDLSAYAPTSEVQQTLKALRRVMLVDRISIDPDPERHGMSIAIAIRHLWLIGHRAGILRANMQQLQLSQKLSSGQIDAGERAQYQEALDLLSQYIDTQEGYGNSIRQELQDLSSRILF